MTPTAQEAERRAFEKLWKNASLVPMDKRDDGLYICIITAIAWQSYCAGLRAQQSATVSLDRCELAVWECEMVNDKESTLSFDDANRYAKAVLESLKQQGVKIEYE